MWEELGMDVETHDLLCEALPQAFGDVYLSQEKKTAKDGLFQYGCCRHTWDSSSRVS